MIGSWWRSHSTDVLNVSPVESRCIELVQIVQIISSISTSEHVNFVFVAVSCMHVARTRWLTCKFVVEPFELLKIENMHIICSKRSLTKPTTNDVKTISDKGCCVSISSLRRRSTRLHWFLPAVFFCIEYPQVAMVFLAIVAPKNVELLVEQRSSMIFYLRSRYQRTSSRILLH